MGCVLMGNIRLISTYLDQVQYENLIRNKESLQNIPSVESPPESKGREDGLGTLEAQHRSEAEVYRILQEAPNIIDLTH